MERLNKSEMALSPIPWLSMYLVYLLLRQVVYVTNFLAPVQYVFVAWGYLLLIYHIVIKRGYKKLPGWPFLIGLLATALLTLVLHIDVNPIVQIKSTVFFALSLFLVFFTGIYIGERPHRHRNLAVLLGPAQIVTMLQAAVSIYTLAIGYGALLDGKYRVGILSIIYGDGSRPLILFGFNVDSNHAAAFSVISLLFSLWLIRYRKNIFSSLLWSRLFVVIALINLPLETIYIIMSNSRGARLSLVVAFLVIIILVAINKHYWLKDQWQPHIAVGFAVGTIIVGLMFALGVQTFVFESTTKYYVANNIRVETPTVDGKVSSDYVGEKEGKDKIQKPKDKAAHNSAAAHKQNAKTQRDTSDSAVYSKGSVLHSAREAIWWETLQLWTYHKFFGIGPYNTEHFSIKYNVQYSDGIQMLKSGWAVHNSYLDVLVSYGLSGVLLYLCFIAAYLKKFIQRIRQRHVDAEDHWLLFVLFFIGNAVFFLTDAFLGLDYMFAWILAVGGYLVAKPESLNPQSTVFSWNKEVSIS